jgi:serine/threonine protein phosphatase PrpC
MDNYQTFAITKVGSSHKKAGKDCQDYSRGLPPSPHKNPTATVAIADGHGDDSCFRSKKGAEFACHCTLNGIRKFTNEFEHSQDKNNDEVTRTLIKHIISKWQISVEEDYNKGKEDGKKSNFSEGELAQVSEKYRKRYENGEILNRAYGTTLMAAVVTEHYWLGIHIGDGRFTVLYEDGEFCQPVQWDPKCFLNTTTSICDDDAAECARFCFFLNKEKPPPVAVFLCSDGIDDNYPVEDNEKHLYKLYRTIALAFAEDGFENACKQLNDLVEKFANEGKGDDSSIAGFINMEKLKKVASKWKE